MTWRALLLLGLLCFPGALAAQDYAAPPVGLQILYSNGAIETVVAVEGDMITTTWAQPTGQLGRDVMTHYIDRVRTWRGLLIDRMESVVTEIDYADRYQTVTTPRQPAELFPLAAGKTLSYQVKLRDDYSREIYQEIDGQLTVGERESFAVGEEVFDVWFVTDRFIQYPKEGEVIDNEIVFRYAPAIGMMLSAQFHMNGYPLDEDNYEAYRVIRP